jgi:hypothetical protein
MLIGLAVSFVVLLGFVLPQILAGRNLVSVSVIGSLGLLAVTLYLTQGWALKSHAALGRSLGIDTVPLKTCNWNCVYCQLGHTVPLTDEGRDFSPHAEILPEVKQAHEDPILAIAGGRYEWIARMVRVAVNRPKAGQVTLTERIDQIAVHSVWGMALLLGIPGYDGFFLCT